MNPEQRERSDRVSSLASILDLRLRDIKADLKVPGPKLPLTVDHEILPAMVRLSEEAVVYHVTYKLEATSANNRRVMEAQVTMSVVLSLKPGLSEADLQAFGSIGALDIVHPYVREVVHNLTGRMGLPPLVLDIKIPASMLELPQSN